MVLFLSYSALLTITLYCVGGLVLYTLYGVIYRLYLSPIAKFPGPKLAALTQWYEFYYDVILRGQYTFHIAKLHSKYGPIIRINPWELHVSSPHFHETLYNTNSGAPTRDKYSFFTKKADANQSTFSTIDHATHRKRRAALNPYFSTASVGTLLPVVRGKVELFLKRVRGFMDGRDGEVMVISDAFAAFANDVVSEYSFARSSNRLGHPTFDPDFHHAAVNGLKRGPFLKHFNFILKLRNWIPEWIAIRIIKGAREALEIRKKMYAQVSSAVLSTSLPPSPYHSQKPTHKTIFTSLLLSPLPPSEKSIPRLAQEAFTIIPAGTISTSWTFSVGTYHILASPTIHALLRAELLAAFPPLSGEARRRPEMSLAELGKCDFLTGCIMEALRLSYGISSRNQRISPSAPLVFTEPAQRGVKGKEWVIPPGTPTGMSTSLIHHDESIFPDSHAFKPERWVDRKERERLGRYMVSFGRGTRACLGINLAWAELYLLFGGLIWSFGGVGEGDDGKGGLEVEGRLGLWETGERDVRMESDLGVAVPWEGSKGVRVKVLRA